ncbi:YgjV family protein [Terrisporobacter glycolicus]|uniref:Bacterial inner membrane protein n=1 Tax=Terrisporobacter glycolicus ATCC 14880 = DSM 1288 TaxID=1121315 RepID=A0ABZ2EXG8_9FIRM|nr:YgjV family protein [Terrisporobacter glycolicus]
MFSFEYIELVGYAASILIAISLTMTDIYKLRIINSIGCLMFVIYGLNVGAYPVALANAIIIIINIYNLYKLKGPNNKS